MRSKLQIIIRVVVPEEASEEAIAEFVADSLEWAGGCRHPEDPMFNSLKVLSVRIGQTIYANTNDAGESKA
jgi:hypothetical protein